MADIAIVTAGRVEVVDRPWQELLEVVASEAITAGAPNAFVPSSTGAGYVANSDANSGTAALKKVAGIATRTARANAPLTIMKRGLLDGFDLSGLDYFAPVYASDTVGRLADAVSGTTALPVGRVVPAHGNRPVTDGPDRLLLVDIPYAQLGSDLALNVADQEDVAYYDVEDLSAGADISARTVFAHPRASTLVSLGLLLIGSSTGIDGSNTMAVTVTDGAGNTIVTKTYGATPPTANALNDLGSLDGTHKLLTAGEVVKLAITNGATADPPAMRLVIRYIPDQA